MSFLVRFRAVALATALFAIAGAAQAAAQLSADPLLLRLPAQKLATSLTLGNTGTQDVTVQAELRRWNQDSGVDSYSPATGLLVSPPIFSLAAQSHQVLRVGRLQRGAAPAVEQAYRLYLAEVPDDSRQREQGLSTVMQLSLPVFVPPADPKAAPQLSAQVQRDAERGLRLTLSNAGAVHDKLTGLRLLRDGQLLAERNYNFYVLARARRELHWAEALDGITPGALELELRLQGRARLLRMNLPAP